MIPIPLGYHMSLNFFLPPFVWIDCSLHTAGNESVQLSHWGSKFCSTTTYCWGTIGRVGATCSWQVVRMARYVLASTVMFLNISAYFHFYFRVLRNIAMTEWQLYSFASAMASRLVRSFAQRFHNPAHCPQLATKAHYQLIGIAIP